MRISDWSSDVCSSDLVGQLLFDFVRSPTLQTAIAILFVIPAAFAGYQLVYGIAGFAISSGITLTLLSVVGGGFIGSSAWKQLVSPSFLTDNPVTRSKIGRAHV